MLPQQTSAIPATNLSLFTPSVNIPPSRSKAVAEQYTPTGISSINLQKRVQSEQHLCYGHALQRSLETCSRFAHK
jgi:hypothetical protein